MVIATVEAAGHEVLDLGVFNTKAVDYPDYAAKVAKAIQVRQAERGILLCGSGWVPASLPINLKVCMPVSVMILIPPTRVWNMTT